jgi:2-enoate reductase
MPMLFEPCRIGRLEIRNRIVMAPMGTTGMVELDGRYSQRAIDYFVARAKGGVGLIITGLMAADVEVERRATSPWSHLPRIDSHLYIARLSELTDEVHEHGAKIAAQLTAGYGRVARGTIIDPSSLIAPSSQPWFWDPNITVRELSTEEIGKLIKAMGAAAARIKTAGFDAIELHGHEGYLIDQFMTEIWNKRTDNYGGDLNDRLRFPIEIIESIRKASGPDFPIIFRFAARHCIDGGREIDESIIIAKILEKAGVNCLHIDAGCYDSLNWAHPTEYMGRGPTVEYTAAIKREVNIPVIAVGRLGYPELAQKVIAEGKADFIALGRPLLADPEWPNKVKERRYDDVRPCIGDHDGCLGRLLFEHKYVSCTVNPQTGMEKQFTIHPASQKKSVLVIGGGPAGMEAARVAALRGHKVTLWEKNAQLGGNLIPASIPDFKFDIKNLLKYLTCQMRKLGVQIESNKEATPELVKNANPDEVIIATGATPIIPEIPGAENNQVATAIDVLLGKKPTGEKVLVVGGGHVGCETALWLSYNGKQVTVVEKLEEVIADMFKANRQQLLQMLADANVKTMTRTEVLEITNHAITIQTSERNYSLQADTIILAVGLKPHTPLIDNMKDAQFSIHMIGDCVKPRKIMDAIWEAFKLGLKI